MSFKEAYEMKMDCQIGEWEAKIEELEARVEKADAEQKIQYNEYIRNLRSRKKELQNQLDGLRAAREIEWEGVKGGVDEAWEKLKTAVELVDETIP